MLLAIITAGATTPASKSNTSRAESAHITGERPPVVFQNQAPIRVWDCGKLEIVSRPRKF